ncbi:MAG TPA: PHP domain-containing protein, partial [Reyranella sp.]|nr:PHP domain-containing protein [Reyranella sp.]
MMMADADVGFVHLHVHSSFSLLEGALSIGKLAELAKKDRQPAIALTDTGNLFGALEFSEKLAGSGIQPILGCTLAVDFADQSGRGPLNVVRPRIVLIAANEQGWQNLIDLVSRSFLDTASDGTPHIKLDWLAPRTAGLIALTGGPSGPIDRALAAGSADVAEQRLATLAGMFGDRLYVEIQRHGVAEERRVDSPLIELAYRLELPLVATNEPFFAGADDYEAHDALICIAEGRLVAEDNRRQLTPEHRFRTRAEMATLFADLPEALFNTIEIARRCS